MTVIISLSLLAVGCGIAISGLKNIIKFAKGESLAGPGILAFAAAILSVIVKEILYRITLQIGKKIESSSVKANAYHHRSDALSSLGAGAGIGGAIFLGEKWAVLDPAAALIVSFFLIKEAISIGREALEELLEKSLSDREQNEILKSVASLPEIVSPHNLRTRKVGNLKVVELHIRVDGNLSVREGHHLAHLVENRIIDLLGKDEVHVSVHVEPLEKYSNKTVEAESSD